MTTPIPTDSSWRRCLCGERMRVEVGQHETTGALEVVHRCPDCGRVEVDPSWRDKPRVTWQAQKTADRLMQLRMGER